MDRNLMIQLEAKERFKKEQDKDEREYNIKSITDLTKQIKTMGKKIKELENRLNSIEYPGLMNSYIKGE